MAETALPRNQVAITAPEAWAPPELSIVVSTLNENGNVPLLVLQLGRALKGIGWDDSEMTERI